MNIDLIRFRGIQDKLLMAIDGAKSNFERNLNQAGREASNTINQAVETANSSLGNHYKLKTSIPSQVKNINDINKARNRIQTLLNQVQQEVTTQDFEDWKEQAEEQRSYG